MAGIRHKCRRAEQNMINHAENCCGHPNAQRESQHSDNGEAKILAKHPRTKTDVPPKGFDPRQSAPVSIGFFHRLYSSQLDHSLASRFLGRHAQAKIVISVQLEMALNLLVEFPVFALLVKQAAKSQNPFAKSFHRNSSFVTKRYHRID